MNINFEKTDQLIELIEHSCNAFTFIKSKAEYSLQKKRKELYEKLVQISASKKSEKQKQAERIKAFAKEYKLGNDLAKAEAFLKCHFDEEAFQQYLTRAYWQIQSTVIFTDDTGNNFTDKVGLKKLIEKQYPDEPCKDVIVDVVSKQPTKIKDIEKEFWTNCTDTSKINDYCNIYRERWKTHLKQIDEKYYSLDAILFNENNELHQYFKELRQCGLLQQSELYIEGRLQNIAHNLNYVCNEVKNLFRSFRSATKLEVDSNSQENSPNKLQSTPEKPHFFVSLDFFEAEKVQLLARAYEKGAKYFVSDNDGYKAQVYVPELFYVLKCRCVPIGRTEQTFDGKQFIKPYIKGHKHGVDYFKNSHELKIDTLYNNSEQYVKDLHINYFHHDPVTNNKNRGWSWWENSYPFDFSENVIENYGFYAGIISELKKLQIKHPAIFKDFRSKCELDKSENEVDVPALKTIFDAAKPGYDICLQLFKELEFVDEKGKTINTTAGDLMGLIDALNAPTHTLIKDSHTYTYDQLMQIFQQHLKIPFTAGIKRRGKGFDNVKEKALKAINSYMRKARVS